MSSREKLNIYQIHDLLQSFYEHRYSMVELNEEKEKIKFILYDAFQIRCSIDDQYRYFGIGLEIGKKNVTTTFLGKKRSLNNDYESIKESFQIIDDYCRASLPDKFLKAYDEAYLPKQKKEGSFFVKIKKIFEK